MFCPKCGAQTADQSAFCANCGNALTEPVQPVQQPAPQPVPVQQPTQLAPAKAPMSKGILASIIVSSVVILASIVVLLVTLLGGGKEEKDPDKKPSATKQSGRVTQSTESDDDQNDTNPGNDDDDGGFDLDFGDLFGGDVAVDGTPATEAMDDPVGVPATEPVEIAPLPNGSENISDLALKIVAYWNDPSEDFFILTLPQDYLEPALEQLYSGSLWDWIMEKTEQERQFRSWLEDRGGTAHYTYLGDRETPEMLYVICETYAQILDLEIEDVRVIEIEEVLEYYQDGSYKSNRTTAKYYTVKIDGIWYFDMFQWIGLY